jgi:hypothetical protein
MSFMLRQSRTQTIQLLVSALAVFLVAREGAADVIVLANRTTGRVTATLRSGTPAAEKIVLPPGEVVPVFTDGRIHIGFLQGSQEKQYQLDVNSAYYFGQAKGGVLDLQRIGLGEETTAQTNLSLPGTAQSVPFTTIPVKILVDEEEAARPGIWERRLRNRVEAASTILEKYCRVRLSVVAVGTWNSDNGTNDFFKSLYEFEQEVSPSPGRLAIGFTSQYQVVRGRVHLAGTRGPLKEHILLREWSQHIGEPERLELLVHELGHHLGASHSREPNSVMRPVLGDKQAVRANFRVRFDPVNALVIAMVGEEMRRRNVRKMEDLSPETRNRLSQIYGELSRTMPNDPASPQFVRIMEHAAATPVVGGAQAVLQEIMRAARENDQLPAAGQANPGQATRRTGDELTEFYVRRAATRARTLPKSNAANSFILAIGLGMGDPNLLRQVSKQEAPGYEIETSARRTVREAFMGKPTIHGRSDLAQHFFVSAYLTATVGDQAAIAAGLSKELIDARRQSGFSFVDVTADKAGIAFASNILNGRLSLEMIADEFTIEMFVPSLDAEPEGLSAEQLAESFGGVTDERFQKQLGAIDRRILALPPYQGPAALTKAE